MGADCFCIYASTGEKANCKKFDGFTYIFISHKKYKCTFYPSALFSVGRGVMVERKNRDPQFGYIVANGTDHGQIEADKLERLWKKKKRQTFVVKFVDENGEEGETISGVEAHCMRMVPIRDLRHVKYSMSFDEEVPAGVDLDEYSFEHEKLPDGISWQYLDSGTGSWVNYPKGLAGRIERMYAANSSHYLYTPGNPHCVGQMVPEAVLGQEVGSVKNAFLHDTSTNQIIFEVSSRGNWLRGHHTQTDNMTERNFYTGMQRRVRRVGGVPRSGGDSDGHKQQQKYLFESGYVDWSDTREKCGLCGKTEGPFMTTECCGRTLCDTEGQYRVNSHEREGQCARNHRLNSVCYHHHAEGHDGNWKQCTKCQEDFHPYDYAVKATSQAQSGTIRRYNFDDNVRTDIHPADVPFPQCDACGLNVDTTEETIRTLGMRKNFGSGKVTCSNCG